MAAAALAGVCAGLGGGYMLATRQHLLPTDQSQKVEASSAFLQLQSRLDSAQKAAAAEVSSLQALVNQLQLEKSQALAASDAARQELERLGQHSVQVAAAMEAAHIESRRSTSLSTVSQLVVVEATH